MQYTSADRRLVRLHSDTPPAIKLALLTTPSSFHGVNRHRITTRLKDTVRPAGQNSEMVSEGAICHEIRVRIFLLIFKQASELQLWKQIEDPS